MGRRKGGSQCEGGGRRKRGQFMEGKKEGRQYEGGWRREGSVKEGGTEGERGVGRRRRWESRVR